MLKRTLIVVAFTSALILSAQHLQSVHGVLMTETEVALLDARSAAATEFFFAPDSNSNQQSSSTSFASALKAPFKALGRIFGGKKKKEIKLERMTEKDMRNFESTPADVGNAAVAVKVSAGVTISNNSEASTSAYLVAGRDLLNAGKLNEAIAELSLAVSNNPNSGETHNLLGLALEQKGLRARALKSFEDAVRLNGDDAEYANNLGYLFYKTGEYEQATKHLKRAAKLAPGNSRIWNNLGLAQTERGKFNDAYESFARAHGKFKGHLNIAIRLESLGREEEAIKHLRKAATIDPRSTDVLNRLASLYDSTGKEKQAQGVRNYLAALRTLAKVASE